MNETTYATKDDIKVVEANHKAEMQRIDSLIHEIRKDREVLEANHKAGIEALKLWNAKAIAWAILIAVSIIEAAPPVIKAIAKAIGIVS